MENWTDNLWVWAIILSIVGAAFAAGQWKKEVDLDRDTFRKTLKEIRKDIKKIFKRLPSKSRSIIVTGSSPLHLTDKGQSISKTLNAAQWAKEIAPSLKDKVKGMMPYDIQEFCQDYVYDEFQPTPEQEEKIKECAYDNALDRQEILDVFAIELRDRLLPKQED